MKKLTGSKPLTILFLTLSAVGVGVLSLWFACVDDRTAMFLSYFTHPLIAVLNLTPVVLLALVLYMLTNRAWLAYLLTAALTMGLTMGNFFKLTFRNDPVLFEDLLLLKEAGDMAGKYQLFVNKSMLLALFLLLAGLGFLFFFARGRLARWPRAGGLALLLLAVIPLKSAYMSAALYQDATRNEDLISPWSATQVYTSKGLVYPFLYSIKSASDAPPDGYDPQRAKEILSAYQDADIPEGEKVDFFSIQLEAYNDFTKFGVPALDPSVYEEFHKLEAEGYSGDLVTNIFAGGTVDTERCYLTGCSRLGSFRVPTNSYAWYFQKQGYYTQGSHSCFAWFYNRENVNANLGLQDYWYVENRYGEMTGGGVGFDAVLIPDILKLYEEHRAVSDAPYFSFSVTYQGHGPYDADTLWWGEGYLDGGDYPPDVRAVLENYFGSIKDTNDHLKVFFDTLRASDRPAVVVLFGDHNPWLGDGNSIYHLLGIDLDLSTQEGFLNYYATRYLIWANDAAKAVLDNDFQGEGPDIGPYFLMNEVFELCGWTGPAYLQAIDPIAERLGVVSTPTGLYFENGTLTDTLTPEGAALAEDYQSLQYDWRRHFDP